MNIYIHFTSTYHLFSFYLVSTKSQNTPYSIV